MCRDLILEVRMLDVSCFISCRVYRNDNVETSQLQPSSVQVHQEPCQVRYAGSTSVIPHKHHLFTEAKATI